MGFFSKIFGDEENKKPSILSDKTQMEFVHFTIKLMSTYLVASYLPISLAEKLKVKKGLLPFGLTKGTIEADKSEYTLEQRAEGGPIQEGKPYVVGEEGPEIIIPKSDGNVLTNDDSQIYAMLLAANPQLQQVSRQRAEKILRARFPEYFEG